MSLIYQALKIVTNEKVLNHGILLISSYYFPYFTLTYKIIKAIY